MNDFWAWLRSGAIDQAIKKAGHDNIKPVIEKTLLIGESAGKFDLHKPVLLPIMASTSGVKGLLHGWS